MTESRKPETGGGDEVVETKKDGETKPPGKTLQELERLQFAELERDR
jgi:hypothetical protein